MAMQPIQFGPFKSGMVNTTDIAAIPDDALYECTNFDFDIDGSLVSRPPIVPFAAPPTGHEDDDSQPHGYYVRDDGVTSLVVTVGDATFLLGVASKVWTQIWDKPASGFVQYNNKVVLISEVAAGGYWEAGTFTATPTMPLGSQIVFYQERLWAYGQKGTALSTTVWFSKLTVISPPSTIWDWAPSDDFFLVGPGDGQWITNIVADSNALLIFRNLSTWQFTYPTSPLQGTLRQLNPTVGAENKHSVVRYESYYFVLNQGYLYQFINYQYYPLNMKKVNLERTTLSNGLAADYRVSLFGTKVIVWYLGSTFVYNIITGTWSRWVSIQTRGAQFFMMPPDPTQGDARVALAVSGENDRFGVFRIQEDPLALPPGEEMDCFVQTKAYALEQSSRHKRLTLWMAEITSANGATGYLSPSGLPIDGVDWDSMADPTLAPDGWDTLAQGTWDNPLILSTNIVDPVPFPAQGPFRQVIKFVRDIRFIRTYFEVRIPNDGTVRTGPVRIYSITPYLRIAAGTSKKVS